MCEDPHGMSKNLDLAKSAEVFQMKLNANRMQREQLDFLIKTELRIFSPEGFDKRGSGKPIRKFLQSARHSVQHSSHYVRGTPSGSISGDRREPRTFTITDCGLRGGL